MMRTTRVGRTKVELSAVGFGTCQLRLVPEADALATLARGFDLGVNWVHVSPDYGGADAIVARAIRESGRDVIPVSDGSGTMAHFERCFENARRLFGRERLPLFGISCIDDQEFVGNDVWGKDGMVERLARWKREGRIDAAYCTTHGTPDYVADLVTCGAFDAVMLAYNPLGFHVLSSFAKSEGKNYEDLGANRERILPLARERSVSLLAMKPLAGGLLGRSRAFPPHDLSAPERAAIAAGDVLRYVLAEEGITAVVPGTASVAEAEENALAGHGERAIPLATRRAIDEKVAAMRRVVCSRCGECEPTCSKGLPISWLFRDAYMWMNPGDTFDAVPRLHYFHLHPDTTLACADCRERTCLCPQGLDIPRELAHVHASMIELADRGRLPMTPRELESGGVPADPAALVVQREVPDDAHGVFRLWVENAGDRPWIASPTDPGHVVLRVLTRAGRVVLEVPPRHDVHPGERAHFVFRLRDEAAIEPSALLFEFARQRASVAGAAR